MAQEITVLQLPGGEDSGGRWSPVLGIEFQRYSGDLRRVRASHRERLEAETPRILQVCTRPLHDEALAVLVLGYVQSGKTSSFTAATALARDNGYQCIIIVGGTTNILLGQTYDRMSGDLELDAEDAPLRWLRLRNPKLSTSDGSTLAGRLRQLALQVAQGEANHFGIPIIFVMKQRTHLTELGDLLSTVSGPGGRGLSRVTTLIVDDEAHMHTPNVARDAETDPSAIYAAMKRIRSCLPSHTLLQYTATPQANLLASIADEFSPNYVKLLSTGEEYAGGQVFFEEAPAQTIKSIPDPEVEVALGPGSTDSGPPASLKMAMASYFIVCANNLAASHSGVSTPEVFSMLVHADGTNIIQARFDGWLRAIVDCWKQVLAFPVESEDRREEIAEFFAPAYTDLRATAKDALRPMEEVLGRLPTVIGQTRVWTVNQGGSKKLDLKQIPYNIVNGGNLLGVGFTIPGLITTHMMRRPGGEQLDTIQQRGRFFGYRRRWVSMTRVWLQDRVRELFKDYVRHESWIRRDLLPFDRDNLPLREWKRKFRLDPSAKPCRRNAIHIAMRRFVLPQSWFYQSRLLEDADRRKENRGLVDDFLSGNGLFSEPLKFADAEPRFHGKGVQPDEADAHGGRAPLRHQFAECSVSRLRTLLSDFVVHESDRVDLEVVIGILIDHVSDEERVAVFRMSGPRPGGRRRRQLYSGGGVELAGGQSPKFSEAAGNGVSEYCGDRRVRYADRITLQLHFVDHGPAVGSVTHEDVVYLGISLPEHVAVHARDLIVQEV